MRAIRERLTYANVMSSLAVVLVLGGGTALAAGLAKNSVGAKQLKKNAVTTAKIKKNAVTGAKVKVSTLKTVPSANNANNLGGTPASGYAKNQLEAIHVVGAAGQPVLENGCLANTPEFVPIGFYKDSFGVVHLTGAPHECTKGKSVFTLPAGFRPTAVYLFSSIALDVEFQPAELRIQPDGQIVVFNAKSPRLDGITFRTD